MTDCAKCGHDRGAHDLDADSCLTCEGISKRDPWYVTCDGFRWQERDPDDRWG